MEEKYEYRSSEHKHDVVINERERMQVSGVVHLESFDDEEIILETELGLLAIRGENLHIKHLDLEKGELFIEGLILELVYAGDKNRKHRGRSLMERLFK